MAEPARASADGTGPGKAKPRKSDPLSPGWVDVRAGVITEAALMRLSLEDLTAAVRELGRRPDGDRRLDAALETGRLHVAIAERWETLACRWVLDQAVLEAVRDDAYERGMADERRRRCRLEAVPPPG